MSRTIVTADASQIVQFMACEKMYQLGYVENLENREIKREALDKGTVAHALIEHYYLNRANGMEMVPAQEDSILKMRKNPEVKDLIPKEDREFIASRFRQYTTFWYGRDFQVLKQEGRSAVEIGFSVPLLDSPAFLFTLEGRIDLIAKTSNFVHWVDHKSQAQARDRYKLEIQFRTYCVATGLSHGMINYFGLQKEMNEQTFRRQIISMSPKQMGLWREKLIRVFHRMAQCKMTGHYETNESQCPGVYRQCQFTEICEATSPALITNIKTMRYNVKPEWKPWRLDSSNLEVPLEKKPNGSVEILEMKGEQNASAEAFA